MAEPSRWFHFLGSDELGGERGEHQSGERWIWRMVAARRIRGGWAKRELGKEDRGRNGEG
jgi:hypothetical protein